MRIFLMLVIVLLAIQTNAQEIKFESEVIDYGKIKIGSDGTRFFKFKNVGDAPLNIKSVMASGPVMPNTPHKPIFPGEIGEIKVRYDTNRTGCFSRPITVHSDAKNKSRTVLTIKGYIYE